MLTAFYDDKSSGIREAWQNGKCVYKWNYKEIGYMSKEKGSTVPAFGHYQPKRNDKAAIRAKADELEGKK